MRPFSVVLQLLLVVAVGNCSTTLEATDDHISARNCFIGISTGPPSKVALLLSSFSTHVSSPASIFVLLTTRAPEHESFFIHLAGRVMFVSIDFQETDLNMINMKRCQLPIVW
jgi:hypothetical protein